MSRKLSKIVWNVYTEFDWHTKKIIGDQFMKATDSVGANVAEGYGRFHYLDKIKFYYNARASLKESRHWLELTVERKLMDNKTKNEYLNIYSELSPKINSFIASSYKMVSKNKK